jgi:polyisoprenoid-binding protein YceI
MHAGAEFNGTFHEYTASVEFNSDALEGAHIDVQIQLASVDTKDKDRDKIIRRPDMRSMAVDRASFEKLRSAEQIVRGVSA